MMEAIIYGLGYFVAGLLAIYVFFWLLYQILNVHVNSVFDTAGMPMLKPVPIPTKDQKTIFHKLAVFLIAVRKWEVVEDWHYSFKDKVTNEETILVIPKGFQFDGASIPRPFWAILSPVGLLLIPGLLHDYGYKYDQLWELKNSRYIPYQKGAGKDFWDILFRDVGKDVNGIILVDAIAWLAVSIGGNSTWDEHRKNNKIPDDPN